MFSSSGLKRLFWRMKHTKNHGHEGPVGTLVREPAKVRTEWAETLRKKKKT